MPDDFPSDVCLALDAAKRGVDALHEARVLLAPYCPDLADLASVILRELEDWIHDVRALLEPH